MANATEPALRGNNEQSGGVPWQIGNAERQKGALETFNGFFTMGNMDAESIHPGLLRCLWEMAEDQSWMYCSADLV